MRRAGFHAPPGDDPKPLIEIDLVPEIALEVSPSSLTTESAAGFRVAGINRINLGVQTWDSGELAGVGRAHGTEIHERAIVDALSAGFSNVCVDLIYGLPGQSDESWQASLDHVVRLRPHTICCYALTLRPSTGYAARGYLETDPSSQYRRYDVADATLTAAGYVQETHVRWVLPGLGGYVQKANHWAGQDVVGFGAGARSYLHGIDLRNGYSVRSRTRTLREYEQRVLGGGTTFTDGFVLDSDERLRKAIILGLGNLDLASLQAEYGVDVRQKFSREFDALASTDLVQIVNDGVSLTRLGQRHRDVAVQLFFSQRVRANIAQHRYAE